MRLIVPMMEGALLKEHSDFVAYITAYNVPKGLVEGCGKPP